MTAATPRTTRDGTLAIGGVLILVGLLAYVMQQADLDPTRWLGGSGWTLFIIGPGVLLLGAALLTPRPAAQGLTIAGSIVTTIGLMLLYMDQTGHWESWSYAWALIPAAVGAALLFHGLRSGTQALVLTGVRLIGIALVLLIVGWWYFETIFQTGRVPFDVGDAWPLVLVAVGGILALMGLVARREERGTPTG